MNKLRKSLLGGIIIILFIDIFSQQISNKTFTILLKPEVINSPIAYWSYPLAFIVGSIMAGLLLYHYSHVSLISIGLFLIGVIHGSYLFVTSLDIYIFMRFSHGFLVASSLTVALTWYGHLLGRKNFRRQIGFLLSPVSMFTLLFISLYQGIFPEIESHWTIFALLFSYIFFSVLSLMLSGYLKEIPRKTIGISIKDLKSTISNPNLIYYCLAVMLGAFTLGTIYQSPFKIPFAGFATLFLSMTLTLITGVGAIGDRIGDTKGVLISFLLMALSLSIFPLLYETSLILIVLGLLGIALGILISCIYGGIEENFNNSTKGLLLGFLHSMASIAYIGGLAISSTNSSQTYSPYFVNCLLIIGLSILYIRRIHQPFNPSTGFRTTK